MDRRLAGLLPDLLAVASVAAAMALLFRDVPGFYFTSDTWGDLFASSVDNPLSYFLTDSYGGKGGRHYRPVWRIAGWIQHKLSGEALYDAGVFYFFQLLWHSLATLNVYLAARLLRCRPTASAVAALAFGIHPAVVEPVAWVAAENYLLAASFGGAAFVLLLASARCERHAWKLRVAALPLATLAALSNECGLGILPGLCIASFLLVPDEPREPREILGLLRTRWGAWWFALGAIGIAYLGLRIAMFGAISNWKPGPSPEPVERIHEIAEFVRVAFVYLLWDWTPDWIDNKIVLLNPWAYLLPGIAIPAVLLRQWYVRRESWAAFALAAVLCYLPLVSTQRLYVYGEDPPFASIDGSRTIYVALVFLAIAFAPVLQRLLDSGIVARRVALVACAAMLAHSAASTTASLFMYRRASEVVRRFVETLPIVLPSPPPPRVALVGLPASIRPGPVEGVYSANAFAFQVASEHMAAHAVRHLPVKPEFLAVPDDASVPPGYAKVRADKLGNAILAP